MIKFNHFNFNVLDLEKSLAFYEEALGLKPVREKMHQTVLLNLYIWGMGLPNLLWSSPI